jgi:predicted CoA-binding protein
MIATKLSSILKTVKTIAIVGASSNPQRDSYKVMKFLIDYGYEVFPVNPNESNKKILNQKCYSNLNDIKQNIDMVDIFRSSKYVFNIAKEAVSINADILWMQEGVIDDRAADFAKKEGLIVIMDECPKKILEESLK